MLMMVLPLEGAMQKMSRTLPTLWPIKCHVSSCLCATARGVIP